MGILTYIKLGAIGAGAILLISLLTYGVCKVKGCIHQQETIRQYQRADEVRQEDKKANAQNQQEKERITNDPEWDFDAELKRLRQHSQADH